MATFAESLDSLWGVQKHDSKIVREQERIDKSGRELASDQAKTDAANQKLQGEQEKLRQLKTRHKELEDELHRLDDRVKRLESQGTEAGNEAADKQRAKIDDMETEGLELLGQISEQEQVVEQAQSALSEREGVLQTTAGANAELVAMAEAVIAEQSALRSEAVTSVVPELLQVYEEVHARHPGKALCRSEGDFCSACQSELRQQLQVQINARAEIVRCPNCACILDAKNPGT